MNCQVFREAKTQFGILLKTTFSSFLGKSLSAHFKAPFPANGSPRRSEYFGHDIRQEEPGKSLLFVVAEIEDPSHGQRHRASCRLDQRW